jgi:hypothetical protein
MRLPQFLLYPTHPSLGIRHEVVELDLNIAHFLNEAALNQMFEQFIFAPLNVDFHQIDLRDIVAGQEIHCSHEFDLGNLFSVFESGRSIMGEGEPHGFILAGETVVVDSDSLVPAKAFRDLLREGVDWLKCVDPTAIL